MGQIEREIFVTKKEIQDMIQVVQGTSMVPVVIHIMDFEIPSDSTAVAYVRRMNGSKASQLCAIVENSIIFTPRAGFFKEGLSYMQIRVVNAGANLFSFAIEVRCQRNMTLDDSEEEDPSLLEQILDMLGKLREMTNQEMDIIFNGGSVGGDDPEEPGVGTSDYNDLENKPSINNVTLAGALTGGDLHLYGIADDMQSETLDGLFDSVFQ